MATYMEALKHIMEKPTNTAEHGYWYRWRNGEIQRGTEVGNCTWCPVALDEFLVTSDKWNLLEAF